MKKFTHFICLLSISVAILVGLPDIGWGDQLSSDYRLVFMEYPSSAVGFDPNQDLLHPTEKQERLERIKETIARVTLESLFPLLPNIKAGLTGKDLNIYKSAMTMVSFVYKQLKDPIEKAIRENADIFPMVNDVYLVPFNEERDDIFYSAGKISMSGLEQANVLGASVNNDRFPRVVTENIRKLQGKIRGNSDPVSLLAFRRFLFLSEEKRLLTYTLLFRVKPRTEDFKQENDQVQFKKMIIPGSDDGGEPVVARIIIEADLSLKNSPPKLTAEFGEFEAFRDGEFVLKEKNRHLAIPRLEGNKTGASAIKVRAGFKIVEFNLKDMRVSGIDTLLQPGLALLGGSGAFIPYAWNKDDVDSQFQAEINKTIEAKLDELFSSIMGDKKETK